MPLVVSGGTRRHRLSKRLRCEMQDSALSSPERCSPGLMVPDVDITPPMKPLKPNLPHHPSTPCKLGSLSRICKPQPHVARGSLIAPNRLFSPHDDVMSKEFSLDCHMPKSCTLSEINLAGVAAARPASATLAQCFSSLADCKHMESQLVRPISATSNHSLGLSVCLSRNNSATCESGEGLTALHAGGVRTLSPATLSGRSRVTPPCTHEALKEQARCLAPIRKPQPLVRRACHASDTPQAWPAPPPARTSSH